MKASLLKKGLVFSHDDQSYIVQEVQVQSPSARGGSTLYKITARHVVTKQKYEKAYKTDDFVQEVSFERRPVQLLYQDADGFTFMDKESFEQFTIENDLLQDQKEYLFDGIEGISALIADGVVLSIELPTTVVMQIVECAPGLKGASASARTKPAKLITGLTVQIPEYLSQHDWIKINTQSGEFAGRG